MNLLPDEQWDSGVTVTPHGTTFYDANAQLKWNPYPDGLFYGIFYVAQRFISELSIAEIMEHYPSYGTLLIGAGKLTDFNINESNTYGRLYPGETHAAFITVSDGYNVGQVKSKVFTFKMPGTAIYGDVLGSMDRIPQVTQPSAPVNPFPVSDGKGKKK